MGALYVAAGCLAGMVFVGSVIGFSAFVLMSLTERE